LIYYCPIENASNNQDSGLKALLQKEKRQFPNAYCRKSYEFRQSAVGIHTNSDILLSQMIQIPYI
jgi:hypothetical protein